MLPAVCRGIVPDCKPNNDCAETMTYLDGQRCKMPETEVMVSYSGEHGKVKDENKHMGCARTFATA